jgi:hypothetical protein
MVLPGSVNGPDPAEWCRPLVERRRLGALINGEPTEVHRVWMARSLRLTSPQEYAFRIGPLRQWARANPVMPEAHPDKRIDLSVLPPLY